MFKKYRSFVFYSENYNNLLDNFTISTTRRTALWCFAKRVFGLKCAYSIIRQEWNRKTPRIQHHLWHGLPRAKPTRIVCNAITMFKIGRRCRSQNTQHIYISCRSCEQNCFYSFAIFSQTIGRNGTRTVAD